MTLIRSAVGVLVVQAQPGVTAGAATGDTADD